MVASQVSAQLLAPVVTENPQSSPMILYGVIGLLGTTMLILIGVMVWQRRQQKQRDLEVLERVTQNQ